MHKMRCRGSTSCDTLLLSSRYATDGSASDHGGSRLFQPQHAQHIIRGHAVLLLLLGILLQKGQYNKNSSWREVELVVWLNAHRIDAEGQLTCSRKGNVAASTETDWSEVGATFQSWQASSRFVTDKWYICVHCQQRHNNEHNARISKTGSYIDSQPEPDWDIFRCTGEVGGTGW